MTEMTTLIVNLRDDKELNNTDKIDMLKEWVEKIEESIRTSIIDSDVFRKWVGYKKEIEIEIATLNGG